MKPRNPRNYLEVPRSLPGEEREYQKLDRLMDRLDRYLRSVGDDGEKIEEATISQNFDRFAEGVSAFYVHNSRTQLIEGGDRNLRNYVQGSSSHIGAKQFAKLSSLGWKQPLELLLDTGFKVKNWQDAFSYIQDYLRKFIPTSSTIRLSFYEVGSSKPYESYVVGRDSHIDIRDVPKTDGGHIREIVKEGNVQYSLEFSLRKKPLTESLKEEGWTEKDTGFDVIVRAIGYQEGMTNAQNTTIERKHNKDKRNKQIRPPFGRRR